MSTETPDSSVTDSPDFETDGPLRANITSISAYGGGIDDIELRTLRLRVKQLEDERIALAKKIRNLTVSLAVAVSRNTASCQHR